MEAARAGGGFLAPLDSKKLYCLKVVTSAAHFFLSAGVLGHCLAAISLVAASMSRRISLAAGLSRSLRFR